MVRFKNRYLLAELRFHDGRVDADATTDAVVLGALRQSHALCFGDVAAGVARGAVSVKRWDPRASLLLLRCGRDEHREVWGALTMLRDVGGRSVAARVVHVGGTMRSATRAGVAWSERWHERMVASGAMRGDAAEKGVAAARRAFAALQP
jgi:ribonuclease P/MRP protein subunit POP5